MSCTRFFPPLETFSDTCPIQLPSTQGAGADSQVQLSGGPYCIDHSPASLTGPKQLSWKRRTGWKCRWGGGGGSLTFPCHRAGQNCHLVGRETFTILNECHKTDATSVSFLHWEVGNGKDPYFFLILPKIPIFLPLGLLFSTFKKLFFSTIKFWPNYTNLQQRASAFREHIAMIRAYLPLVVHKSTTAAKFNLHLYLTAEKLPSLTSPLAIINHVTCEEKWSRLMIISKHDCICMTIQRNLRQGCGDVIAGVCWQNNLLKCFDLWYVWLWRWLPGTSSRSDRPRPGSCMCVRVCRTWPGHQWSQRLVY